MFRLLLSVFIFLFSFNFLFAQDTVESIIDKYEAEFKNYSTSFITKSFNINQKQYTAIYISSYKEGFSKIENTSYIKNTNYTAYICESNNNKLSKCKKLNLYRLGSFVPLYDISISGRYITFKSGDYYLTLKEKNGEFYLHKFTTLLHDENGEEYGELLSSEDASKNFKIKMEDITIADLIPSRIPANLINNYPSLKNNIYRAVSDFEGYNVNTNTAEFKIGNKEFTAIALTSNYSDTQLISSTSSWCIPAGSTAFICDGTGKKISNCRKGSFNTSATCGSASIVTKDEYITFETSGQDRHGIETYNYTTYRYINGDFYLHKSSTVEHNVEDEETDGETTFHYNAKGKYDTLFAN